MSSSFRAFGSNFASFMERVTLLPASSLISTVWAFTFLTIGQPFPPQQSLISLFFIIYNVCLEFVFQLVLHPGRNFRRSILKKNQKGSLLLTRCSRLMRVSRYKWLLTSERGLSDSPLATFTSLRSS